MNKNTTILIFIVLLFAGSILAQNDSIVKKDSLRFKGQISALINYNENNKLPFWSSIRYIPQLNYKINLKKDRLIDFETSLNIYGNAGFKGTDTSSIDGKIKPYRVWARYSGEQFEFRIGLQKINFGSASLLRPLMWFDQIDPRDPLQLTDGVWAALCRYYFLNNGNIWFWTLYGNKNLKGWEMLKTNQSIPEIGGRFQTPVPGGEAGISYHHRIAESTAYPSEEYRYDKIPENRIALDAKFDYVLGFWFEATWVNKSKNMGIYTNQELFNVGTDYTFGIGNGLSVIFEQLLASSDQKAFNFENATTFSMLSMNYKIGLFDNIGAIFYYDWMNGNVYNFVNWQKQFNKCSLYLMGYANPKDYYIPTQGSAENLYGGVGLQVMFVYNY